MTAWPHGPESVVTVGNFDGLHVGHQALIRRCRERAGTDRRVAVVTFEPLPQTWFNPERAPARLQGVAHKLTLLQQFGVDRVWMLRFNRQLADMPPERFVRELLVEGLCAGHVVVGEDFCFGQGRTGNAEVLATLGTEMGFTTEVLPPVEVAGQRVSSTAIRKLLAQGELDQAATLLGRPYSMLGRVGHGLRLGRDLGYPTANVHLGYRPVPLQGVFAVQARREGGRWHDGVASLGRRPAVGGGDLLLEVHLFDFSGELYNRRLETRFIQRIRDEADFERLEDLVAQMRQDAAQARAVLSGTDRTADIR